MKWNLDLHGTPQRRAASDVTHMILRHSDFRSQRTVSSRRTFKNVNLGTESEQYDGGGCTLPKFVLGSDESCPASCRPLCHAHGSSCHIIQGRDATSEFSISRHIRGGRVQPRKRKIEQARASKPRLEKPDSAVPATEESSRDGPLRGKPSLLFDTNPAESFPSTQKGKRLLGKQKKNFFQNGQMRMGQKEGFDAVPAWRTGRFLVSQPFFFPASVH